MNCPQCRTQPLSFEELGEGLTALGCPKCGGHWIPSYVYWKWRERRKLDAPELPADPATPKSAEKPRGGRLCPECGRVLRKFLVKEDASFRVDRCGNCAGVWLDAGEWKTLKARNLHDNIDDIFTAAWQTGIRKRAAAGEEEAAFKRSLGVDDYTEARRVKAWLRKHPKRPELLAYISKE